MPPVGFELTISAGERPQTYALDRAATGAGICSIYTDQIGGQGHPFFCCTSQLTVTRTYTENGPFWGASLLSLTGEIPCVLWN